MSGAAVVISGYMDDVAVQLCGSTLEAVLWCREHLNSESSARDVLNRASDLHGLDHVSEIVVIKVLGFDAAGKLASVEILELPWLIGGEPEREVPSAAD